MLTLIKQKINVKHNCPYKTFTGPWDVNARHDAGMEGLYNMLILVNKNRCNFWFIIKQLSKLEQFEILNCVYICYSQLSRHKLWGSSL